MNKVFTVRLSKEQVEELTNLARFDGIAIAEEIRESIALLLKSRSQDPSFVQRVRTVYENARTTLASLERGPEVLSALGDPVREAGQATAKAGLAAVAQRTAARAQPASEVEKKVAFVAQPAAAAIDRGRIVAAVSARALVGGPSQSAAPAAARARFKRR